MISRGRVFLPPPEEVQPDWALIAAVARAIAFQGFDCAGPHKIFKEHAAVLAAESGGSRDTDIGGLHGPGGEGFGALAPTRWSASAQEGTRARSCANGAFFTLDDKARMVPTPVADGVGDGPAAASTATARFAFALSTGRMRDQRHSITRTGRVPTQGAQLAETFVEIDSDDAAACRITPATLFEVRSAAGAIVVRAADVEAALGQRVRALPLER